MRRYLLFVSYIGKGFSGVQRQINAESTIVNELETALQLLKPANKVQVRTSSRTDRGVHALCNTLHTDLHPSEENCHYDPSYVTEVVNRYMSHLQEREDRHMRLLKTQIVSDDFHVRYNATGRTYIYRVADSLRPEDGWSMPWTLFEQDRTMWIRGTLDMDLVRQACKMLSGTFDYSSFTNPSTLINRPWLNPVKTISVEVNPARALLHEHTYGLEENFRLWEFIFHGSSFLYKQVRRMVAGILAVGRGVISLQTLEDLLNKKDVKLPIGEPLSYYVAPHGLYLKAVHYNEEDLIEPDLSESTPIFSPSKELSELLHPVGTPILSPSKELSELLLPVGNGQGLDTDSESEDDSDLNEQRHETSNNENHQDKSG